MAYRQFRKALVTGAGGDLGAEICRCLAAAGLDLVITDLSEERLQPLLEQLGRYGGSKVSTFAADLSDHEGLEQTLKRVADEHADIDMLICNAGIDIPAPIERYDWRKAKLHFDINTLANYVICCVFVPRFLERGHGHVTTVISLGGLLGAPYEHAYNGSKAAARMMMDGLRAETKARGVSWTSVFPGYLEGSMIEDNAFDVKKATPMPLAAEKIVDASLQRTPLLKFPLGEAMRVTLANALPVSLRDKLIIKEMKPMT
jgi:short-subunit dehydrogenase